jgi:trehalose 6-phosphate phosphatase
MIRSLFDALPEVKLQVVLAPHLLLCLDFDGTLAPFVDDPAQAGLPRKAHDALAALARHENVSVAIVSGRERADLQARVGIPGVIYAGNHGLEISGHGFIFVEPIATGYRNPLARLAADLTTRLQPLAGAFVEDKGLTLSVHFRQLAVADYEQVRSIVHAALASTSHPFVLSSGDKVFEIRPRVDWNKGNVVGWIKEQLHQPDAVVIYMGDDVSDEDAFAVLPGGITVKVGDASATRARYHVQGPAEVHRFLDWLAQSMSAASCPATR